MYALPAVNALMQKHSTMDAYLQSFTEHFCQYQLQELAKERQQQTRKDAMDTDDTANNTSSSSGIRNRNRSTSAAAEATSDAPEPEDATEIPENLEASLKAAELIAVEIFNKVLTDTVLYYLFVNVKSSSERGGEGDSSKDGNPENKLSVIFQAFLQTAAHSYQQSAAEEDEGEGEGDEAAGADSPSAETAGEGKWRDPRDQGVNAGLD